MTTNEGLSLDALVRRDVLNAVLKHYKAQDLAELSWCPLCGNRIGEYTWTLTNFEKGLKPIGVSGAQCSNTGCLLHNGIIYEDEGVRMLEWQSGILKMVPYDPAEQKFVESVREQEEKLDSNRFNIQLWAEQETIKKAAGSLMTFEEVSVQPLMDKDEKMMRFEMKMKTRRPGAEVYASGWGHDLFDAIEAMGYRIWWMDAEWDKHQLTIIIKKDVVK